MCGIAGKLSLDMERPIAPELLQRMTDIIQHRGPDDAGVWTDGPVGLGSRRLAVLDLSPRGHQPMSNEDESLWIVFNGEIYNFQDLRADLIRRGHVFRSTTDTEVILHLYGEKGAACLQELRGMFAFAIWDTRRRTLFIARDRLGKKPLFYFNDGRVLLFASEPKSIMQDPDFHVVPDRSAIHHYLTYGYVPAPWGAFKGLRKLPPGHYMEVQRGRLRVEEYWRLHYTPKSAAGEHELAEELFALLDEAVRLRLVSDVPVGALLSGGLDSSAVVALMRLHVTGRLQTFSIGFEQPEYDELRHARSVAERFETDHHELVVTPNAAEVLPALVWHYNEPFADSSALPSFAVCALARRFVTVALNGDGGDEAFLGYDRYLGTRLASWIDRIPGPARRGAAAALETLPGGTPKARAYRLKRFGQALMLPPVDRYARWIEFFDPERKTELYSAEFRAEVASDDSLKILRDAYARSDARDFLEATAHADVQLYLPDDLLVKMDIASMAYSLELRSPLLDYRVMEFAARLPVNLKLRGTVRKYLLRRLMKNRLPPDVTRRRKMGFGVPIDTWFRTGLREMAYDLLLDSTARRRGYFEPEVVRRYLDEHISGAAQHHFRLWNLLMLELWHRMFIDRPAPTVSPLTGVAPGAVQPALLPS
jgi:asparagine synthase (glutamine-hydrolysing)